MSALRPRTNQTAEGGERGYILVATCLLLPLLYFLVSSAAWLFWFQKAKEQAQHLCFEHVLAAQNQLLSASNSVLALNPYAKSLSLGKKTAQAAYIIAPPPLKPAAKLAIELIKNSQRALRLTQQFYLKKGTAQAAFELHTLRSKMKTHLQKMSSRWKAPSRSMPRLSFKTKRPQLEISHKDIAPQYRRKKNYSSRQQVSFRWTLFLHKNFAQNLKLNSKKTKWSAQCFSHPRKRSGEWFASLGKARSFWKLSSF